MSKSRQKSLLERLSSHRQKNRLAYRLVFYVVVCSSFFTLLASAVQLYISYRKDLNSIEENFHYAEKTYVPAISLSLYLVNIEQMKLQLNGFLHLQDMVYAEVHEPRAEKSFIISVGNKNEGLDIVRDYPLAYSSDSRVGRPIGTLTLGASLADVRWRLWNRALTIIATNTIKMVFASACILLIFYYLLSRHILKISLDISEIEPKSIKLPIIMNRIKSVEGKHDELDDLLFSINRMLQSISEYNTVRDQTEKALMASEVNLRSFIDNTDDMICARDSDGALIFWNEAFNTACKRHFGVEASKGLKTRDLIPEEQLEKVKHTQEAWRKVLEGERVFEEFMFTWPNGENHFYEINWSPIIIGDEFIGVAEITRDITEKKLAELELQEASQRYRTVADFTYDWEYWESPEGKMLYVSPSCERISGYPAEAYLNNPDLLGKIILKEDKGIWADHRHEAREYPGALGIEFRIEKPNGSIRYIEHACQPVHSADGKFLGIRASNRDITQRKIAEDELKKKDEMLEEAQRIARLGSWEWDIMANKIEWSDETFRIFGLLPQSIDPTYEIFLERVHPEDREEVKAAVNLTLSDPSFKYNIKHRIRKPDGSERVVRERGKVIFNEDDEAYKMIGTVQDITDIHRMQIDAERLRTELAHMERVSTMGVLTASIAHEINQPLAAILSNAQAAVRFLADDRQDLKEVRAALQDIISDDKRAGDIVHSIRNIAGRYDPKREALDFNETIREVLSLVKAEAINRGVSISKNFQPGIPPVYGDCIQIQQVVLNLMMNAFEALKGHHLPRPEVMVSTQIDGINGVLLSVSDSGPGIEPDLLSTIFNSFKTNKQEGLGIGLSICRTIADNHNGQLWAENRPEGGSVFFFKLPLGEQRHE
jgi:PAS domain S-box-containing protein